MNKDSNALVRDDGKVLQRTKRLFEKGEGKSKAKQGERIVPACRLKAKWPVGFVNFLQLTVAGGPVSGGKRATREGKSRGRVEVSRIRRVRFKGQANCLKEKIAKNPEKEMRGRGGKIPKTKKVEET